MGGGVEVGNTGVEELVVVGTMTVDVSRVDELVDVVVGVGVVDDVVAVERSVVEEKPVGPLGRSGSVDVVESVAGVVGKSPVGTWFPGDNS